MVGVIMIFKLIDNHIRRAFSNSAVHYEVLAGLQNEIGRELVQRIQNEDNCAHILDVGMGTGRMTNRLSLFFPDTRVIGIDFSDGMIAAARKKYDGFKIVQADAAALPFREETFDIVVSNLAYQWVDDLEQAFRASYGVLKERGVFCATLFGGRTLEELFVSFENSAWNSVPLLKRLAGEDAVFAAARQAGFGDPEIKTELIKTHFPDMLALLKWLKGIGANRMNRDFYFGRDWLRRANEYYFKNFNNRWGVQASFEVIWIYAKKR